MKPPTIQQVQHVVSLALAAVSRLREEHGLVLDTEDEVIDALAEEGIAADAVLRRLVRAILDAKADAQAADARIEDLRARRNRFRHREEVYRATLAASFETLGWRRFNDAEASVYVTEGRPKVVITDEHAVPRTLMETTVIHTPDKGRILDALQRGETVPGAALANPAPIVTIRSR